MLDINQNGNYSGSDSSSNPQQDDDASTSSAPSPPPLPNSLVADVLNELALIEAGEHSILTFQEMEIMKEIRSRYCYDLLKKKNMAVLLLIYLESRDEVISHLRTAGEIDVDRYIADGSLFIDCDDHSLIGSKDNDFHGHLVEIQNEAIKKGKQGLGIILDISSLLDAVDELLKFESEILQKNKAHLIHTSLLCCYNGFLFDKLKKEPREIILNNHHRKLCAISTTTQ